MAVEKDEVKPTPIMSPVVPTRADKEKAAKEEQERLDKEAEERHKAWLEEEAQGPIAGGPMLLGTIGATPVVFEIFNGVGGFIVVKTDRGELKAISGDYIFFYYLPPEKLHLGVLIKEVAEALLGLQAPPASDSFMTNKQWVDELERRRKLDEEFEKKKLLPPDSKDDKIVLKPGVTPPPTTKTPTPASK